MQIKNKLMLAAILCALAIGSSSKAQTSNGVGLEGSWQGDLATGEKTVRMVLNVKQTAAGEPTATLDLPDLAVKDRPVQHLAYGDRILSFEVNLGVQISYEGVISRDGTEMNGSLTQEPNTVPLNFQHLGVQPGTNATQPAILLNPRRKIELKPCTTKGLSKDTLCGQYQVYEDRTKNSGRAISLNL